ncbi:hypothetical protein SLEP1_g43081 [Rubroshorea leprosula]|uniref:Uncharacterized protein n=1 Tax=Rubroshorea leprosula TaxID=152421 RepID=A0AAV5LBV7_9ROSI|nr:hypothetical protein SLEP1_g43081 [Rubroshorea leprosula]
MPCFCTSSVVNYFCFILVVNSALDPRALLFLSPDPLHSTSSPQLPPPIFRPEIRQSFGISPYFLVLEHLVNPEIPPLCWKFQICAVFFPLSVGLCLCGCEFSAFLNFPQIAAGLFPLPCPVLQLENFW